MLERALELAERGRGTTHPNPVVGAVVERDGEVVGEGWHERKGGPHAEVVALEAAGEAARGATLYVTLEPCDHHGTTPPCVDAILAAGISKVVVGAKDPLRDGIERLREAGVDVELADLWAGPRAERGVADVGAAATAVRHLQGGDDARRASDRAGRALGLGRGEPKARPRAASRLGRGGRGDGHGPGGRSAPRRSRRRHASGSRGASRSAAARCPRARSSSSSAGPSRTSCGAWPKPACSRSCSKAVRPSAPRSSPPASWTRSSCSSRRRSPAKARLSRGLRSR